MTRNIAIVVLILVLALGGFWALSNSTKDAGLRVAVPPFVDTAMTAAGAKAGLFKAQNLNVELVDTTWEGQYELIAGKALDISMSTVDEFINKDANLRSAGQRVIYFLPAWQFRGLGFYTNSHFRPLADFRKEYDDENARKEFVKQLIGHKVVLPEGSVFETAFRQFVKDAGGDVNSIQLINASLDVALNALTDSDVALAAVGSQQRFEAERRGNREAIAPQDLGLDVLTGFIVREEIWKNRRDDVVNFACAWYATVRAVNNSADKGFADISSYLTARGAGTLTASEYDALRKYNAFASTPREAKGLFFEPSGSAYWRRTWDRTIAAMKASGKGNQIPPDEGGFVAPSTNVQLLSKCPA